MSISTRTKVKPPPSPSATYSVVSTGVFVAKVGWTAPGNGQPNDYYVLYRDGVEIATSLTATTYRDTDVVEGGEYDYQVSTVNVNEVEGDTSPLASAIVPVYPVWETGWSSSIDQNTTSNISSRATDPKGAALTFSRQGGTAPAGVTVSSAGVISVGSSTLGTYTVILRADNGQLTSDYTMTLNVTTPITAPGTPANFVVAAQSTSAIGGSFQQGTGQPPTSYDVARSLTGNNAQTPTASGWTSISLSTALATSFTATGLSSNTRYYFRVRALNSGQGSAYAVADDATFSVGGTTYTIPTGTANYDASGVSGGDTIIIARKSTDGTRGPLTITGAVGTAGNRIRIISDPAGLVTMRPDSRATISFLFTLANCHYFDADFDNALVTASGARNRCGLKLTYAANANTTNKENLTSYFKLNATSAGNLTDNFTLEKLWIDGGWATSGSLLANGLGISGNHKAVAKRTSGDWQENIIFRDCVVENTEGEGIYVGSNYADIDSSGPASARTIPSRNIEFDGCWVENTGQDGLNGKSWWEGVNSIHDCTFVNCGHVISNVGVLSAIAMMSSTARVYNNRIIGAGGPGIRFATQNGPSRNVAEANGYGTFNSFDCIAYNNEIIDSGSNANVAGRYGIGIQSGGTALTKLVPYLYSNSITGSGEQGIRSNTTASSEGGGFVQNNIVIGNGTTAITAFPSATTVSGNLTSGITAANCFDAPASDLHLTTAGLAAALGCVGTRGTNYSTTDKDGATRSSSAGLAHVGAFET